MDIRIYDVNGKLVKQTSLAGNGFIQKAELDLKATRFASGVYLLLAETAEKKFSIKLVKR
jgi:hypothetical protein